MPDPVTKKPIVVIISGNGSNLQALIDASQENEAGFFVAAVISNKTDAYGLTRARASTIPTHVVEHSHYQNRETFDQTIMACIDIYNPILVVLAGFMRILSGQFVQHYEGRLINIHPSLLPKYKGINTHQRVLDAGEKEHGTSVHFVTEELDGGPVIMQAKIDIHQGDSVDTLKAKTQKLEHMIYPKVVNLFSKNQLKLQNQTVFLDNTQLAEPIIYQNLGNA